MEEMERRLLADRVSKQEEVMKALSDVHHLVGTQDVVLQPKKDFTSKRPADFSGSSSEDPENWLVEYEEYMSWVEPTRTEAKRRMFSSYLVAKAKTWYINFNMSKVDNWDTVKEKFLSYFDRISPDQRDLLTTVKMRPNENISDFVNLASTAYRKLKLSPSEKLSRFLDAVTPRYRVEIMKSKPTTMEEAMRSALEAEYSLFDRGMSAKEIECLLEKTIDKKLSVKPTSSVAAVETISRPTRSDEQFDLRDMTHTLQESLRVVCSGIQALDYKFQDFKVASVASSGSTGQMVRDSQRSGKVLICYKCNGENHYARDCALNQQRKRNHDRGQGRDQGRDQGRSRQSSQESNHRAIRWRSQSPYQSGDRKN